MKVVLVAENGFIRSSVHVNLRSAGHAVTEAEPTCLYDVLAVMREEVPHLVILDYEIPSCHCETLVRIVREDPILAMTPILLIVESTGSAAAERMGRWDQVQFLQKPLQVDVLLQAARVPFPALSARTSDWDPAV